MRLLLVTPVFYPHRSGAVTQLHKLAKTLQSYDHYVEILTAYPSAVGSTYYDGVPIEYNFSISPSKAYNFSPAIVTTFLKKRNFDLVHAWDYQSFPCHFIALSRYLFNRRIPFCFSPQYHIVGGTQFRTALRLSFKLFGNFAFQEANKIICISRYELKNLQDAFSLDEKKIELIPLGVDLPITNPTISQELSGNLQVLYVGRLEKYKGIDLLLKALAILKGETVQLMIVGRGSIESDLMKLAKGLHIEKRVTFCGHVSDTELDRIYKESDVLALPSLFESFGLTMAEAVSYGKVVISTNVGFMYDLCQINEMQRALLLPMPPSSSDIADKIKIVIHSPDLAQQIASRNFRILASEYSWKRVGERINNLYMQLAQKN
jgi:glycosyltransferase involved in cell wall biosynthesis